ncbi:MAG: acetyl-CoA carboxylase biotin carboxylase subunit [Acidobacteriota bacterium]|nr:acetyl-CoA carboxylase biotin carboxylase subunit [Acidobacteriota bacterium]
MFRKILIANRGEIAVRVARACWDLKIPTVAVYSSVDRTAPHLRLADEAYPIGPAAPAESYLKIDRIIEVASHAGADAIHPGYGFLAENPRFADACEAAGITFIGPPAEAMRSMADKVRARTLMQETGVPVVPGTGEFRGSTEEATAEAERIGFPVMIKACAGGGGKGMRVSQRPGELAGDLQRARSEAKSAFGDDAVYIEKMIERPRHIEVQILFDTHGRGVAVGERECSVQRRHQKLVEETPSTIVDAATRARISDLAVAAGEAVRYTGAGTVEFLCDEDRSFYFMEMNTRLQVEHTVTEEVYGVDLVEAQIRVAAGEPLPWTSGDLVPRGHAMECRITAEDPSQNFMPSPGRIEAVRIPSGPGVRDDSAVAPGYVVPVEYDPLVAKLITYGSTRTETIRRMRRALDEYRLEGLTTNIPFLRRLMDHPSFLEGDLHTTFLDEHGDELLRGTSPTLEKIAVVAAAIHAFRTNAERSLHADATGARPAESSWLRLGRERGMRGGR